MSPTAPPHPHARATACLGCRDCSGLCQAVLELVAVPESVLRQAQHDGAR